MFKAIIKYYDEDRQYLGLDRSDGFCFPTLEEAKEWAEDYSSDKMMRADYETDYEIAYCVIEYIDGDAEAKVNSGEED